MIIGATVLFLLVPVCGFLSGYLWKIEPTLSMVMIGLSVVSLALAGTLLHVSVDERWIDWSECEDGVTQIEQDSSYLTIDDCDSYYNFPGGE